MCLGYQTVLEIISPHWKFATISWQVPGPPHKAVHFLQSSSLSYISCELLQRRGEHVGNHMSILDNGGDPVRLQSGKKERLQLIQQTMSTEQRIKKG